MGYDHFPIQELDKVAISLSFALVSSVLASDRAMSWYIFVEQNQHPFLLQIELLWVPWQVLVAVALMLIWCPDLGQTIKGPGLLRNAKMLVLYCKVLSMCVGNLPLWDSYDREVVSGTPPLLWCLLEADQAPSHILNQLPLHIQIHQDHPAPYTAQVWRQRLGPLGAKIIIGKLHVSSILAVFTLKGKKTSLIYLQWMNTRFMSSQMLDKEVLNATNKH